MPKRSSKREDANQAAFRTLQEATGDRAKTPAVPEPDPKKNPAAVALGRLGGLKGGKARAKSLSKTARSAISRRAAEARWDKKRPRKSL
jgi:hypothetical protein